MLLRAKKKSGSTSSNESIKGWFTKYFSLVFWFLVVYELRSLELIQFYNVIFLPVKSEPNSARASPTANITNSAPSSRSASPQMRSTSATPSTPPPSQAIPAVTSQAESSPNENDRGDLIEFYNKVDTTD